jgi:hypothetical protein
VTTVRAAGGTGQAATFADLGTGTTDGARVYTAADSGNHRDAPPDTAAIDAIDATSEVTSPPAGP